MDVIMPQLGESVEEGTISAWHKKPGDRVGPEDILLEVETDKAAMEVPALTRGTLREILVGEGETAKVGTTIAILDTEDEEKETGKSAGSKEATSRGGKTAKAIPTGQEPGRESGSRRSAGNGEDGAARENAAGRSSRLPKTAPDGTPLSPAVRRLIAQHALDPAAIRGTGRDGRIQRSDVLAHLERAEAPTTEAPAADAAAGEVVAFTRLRKRIARNMLESKRQSAHVLQAVEVDFSAVEAVRGVFRAAWKETHGRSLTYLPFIARAACLALADFPRLNAIRDGDSLVVYKRVNLGIAVDLELEGLVVPVIKGADSMNVPELGRAIAQLSERARANKLTPEDMSGGSYTLSNNGSYGTLITAPIINQPQVAVLSSDGIRKRPWVVEGENGDSLAIRPVGILAQSFDHCAVDGAYSGAFLRRVKEIIETRDWARDFL